MVANCKLTQNCYSTAKFEDKDDQIPTVEQMMYFARMGDPDHYTREEFHKMELYMLRFFDWGVSHPTPAHYADYYLTHGDGLDEGSLPTSPAATMPEGLRDPMTRKLYMDMCNTFFIEAALKGKLYFPCQFMQFLTEWFLKLHFTAPLVNG